MTTHETTERTDPPTFAEIRESLADAGRRYREIAALMAENEARASKNEVRARKNEAKARKNEAKAKRGMAALQRAMAETDRRMRETDRQMKDTDRRMKETDRQMKETDRQLKRTESIFTSPWEKLLESLVEGDLVPLLNGRGIAVEGTYQRSKGRRNGKHFEFDILAVNRRDVVVVEVKTTLRSEDVTRFLTKLSAFTDWAREYRGKRILGAVAYLKSDSAVTTYAERKGLFIIRATGSSASIRNAEDFEPRSFA